MATKKQGNIDITKVGPVGFRLLQAENNLGSKENLSEDYLKKVKEIESTYQPISPTMLGLQPDTNIMSSLGESGKGWGESVFDKQSATIEQFGNLGDVRAERQPWYAKVGAGLAKGAILAGTTFLDGTIGLAAGVATAINEGRWSGLWDNDFSKALQSINKDSENWLPNYYSEQEQNSPWYENIFTANFIGDKFIKNLGFTVGAFYSGNVWAKGIQATKLPNLIGKAAMGNAGKAFDAAAKAGSAEKLAGAIAKVGQATNAPAIVTSGVGAIMSAVNEGRIEALNNSGDWYELEKMKVTDYYKPLYEDINREYEINKGKTFVNIGSTDNPQYRDQADIIRQQKINDLNNKYEQSLAKINEDRLKMGNADLLMNIPILTASNIIQFGKLYANGFKTARKGVNIVNKGKFSNMSASEAWAAAKAEGMTAEQFVKEFGKFGTEEVKRGALANFGKNIATTALPEGLEEISQKAASNIAGDYYSTDVHNFYKAKTDPDASLETLSWVKAFAQGINETLNEGSSWEEFFIGALTGALGMPVFGSANTSSADTYLGKGKAVGLRGGIFGESLAKKEERARAENIANYINSRIQSPEFKNYYQGLIRHNKFQKGMNQAAIDNSEFDYKNNEFAQMVSDIMMFDNAGKIGDLLTLIDSAYDTSSENLASIVKNTTSTITDASGKKSLVGPFAQYATINDANEIVANFGSDEQQKEMANKLTETKNEMLKTISDYQLAKDEIDVLTGQRLTDEQLQELTWIKMQSKNWLDRGTQLAKESRESILKIRSSIKDSADLFTKLKTDVGAHQRVSKKQVEGKDVYIFEDDETYNKLSEAEKRAVQNVAAIDSFLAENDEGLFLALGNPNNSKTIEGLKSLLKEVTTASPTEVETFNQSLDDISKLREGINSYNTKLKEYLENPEKQAAEMAKANKDNAEKEVDNKRNAVARRINFDAPTAEVAKALDENSNDIVAMGGFNEFIKTLTPEQRKKAKAAKRFTQALNSIKENIDSSDLTDEQKRIAHSLLDKEVTNSKDINELGKKIVQALDKGEVRDSIFQNIPTEGVDDLARLAKIEEAEAKLKDFFDEHIKKAADAVSALEKTESDKLRKAAKSLKEEKEGEPEEIKSKVPKEAKKDLKAPKEPKQGPEEYVPDKEDAPEFPTAAKVKEKNAKPTPSPNPGIGGAAFHTRPQLSEFYLHGRNAQTYVAYIKEHPEAIPQGVDKEAFVKYVEAVTDYLNRHGAFVYVSEKLKIGDSIEFKIDPTLNEAAGVPVVLMVTKDSGGNEQVIGSLPTSIDFEAINKQTGKKEGEVRAAQKALYDEVLKRESSKIKNTIISDDLHDIHRRIVATNGDLREAAKSLPEEFHQALSDANQTRDNEEGKTKYIPKLIEVATKYKGNSAADAILEKVSSPIQNNPLTTQVRALRGGRIEFNDNLERTVANIFSTSDEAPVIAVLSENTSSLTTEDPALDAMFIQPTASSNAVSWGIYAMVPTNNGKYLPALCWSTKLRDIIDDPNDWYIKQTIEAIKKIPRSIADLNDNIKAVYKWIPLKGFSIQIGRADGSKFEKETEDVSRATHVRISFSNKAGKPDRVTLNITNGQLSDDEIRSGLENIIRKHPDITTNVDIKKLTNSKEHQEYRKNIAKYLHSNIMFPHSVNDWFNYKPTEIEEEVTKKEKAGQAKANKNKGKPEVEGKGNTIIVTLDNVTYSVTGTHVEDADGNSVSEEIKQKILLSLSKPAEATPLDIPKPKGDKAFVALNMGGESEGPKIGRREAAARRFGSKKLAVTDTTDETATQEAIYKNAEKVKAMFPQLSEAGRIVIVNGLIRTVDEDNNPIDAYGEFRDGILYISNQSPAGTAYHEAFHYVTDMLLSDTDRVTMFNAAKEKYGELPEIALEEKLAEDFRHFMNGFEDTSLLGKIKTFFRNLKHIINSLRGRTTYLDNLFFDIYKNRYQNRRERFGTFEEQRILKNAPRDSQGRLLAPNGKPSNLTERQYAQVRTKAFKDWFGDWENDPKNASKVVDENGEPMVVYHGNRTNDKIEVFDKSKIGSQHKKIIDGFWFIADKELAKFEYSVKSESVGKGFENLQFGEVLPVFLNLRNPVTETQKGLKVSNSPFGPMATAKEGLSEFVSRVQNNSENNDGFILTVVDSDGLSDPFYQSKQVQLVAKESNQIKSATENTGMFSPRNDNFYDRLIQYKQQQLGYNALSEETKQSLEAKRITREDYEDLSVEDKESILFCLL